MLFAMISLTSLLSNREISKSLRRARLSERALLKERSSLEEKVIERTSQLEQLQKERLLQEQRFAEFGRISAGLIHDIANPLTVATLRLEQLNESKSTEIVDVIESIKWLERYTNAARRQLMNESKVENIILAKEVSQIIDLTSHKARRRVVKVKSEIDNHVILFGDPSKFSQIMVNLISNAIDAYIVTPSSQCIVLVTADKNIRETIVTVQDWGIGINKSEIENVFRPFYGTKRSGDRGQELGFQ